VLFELVLDLQGVQQKILRIAACKWNRLISEGSHVLMCYIALLTVTFDDILTEM
jgi:hypothetical protein